MTETLDPKNINGRVYRQLDVLLKKLETSEHVTVKELTAALLVITRIQFVFVGIRKEKLNDDDAGSAVRKYAGAFKQNDARGRKKVAGGRAHPAPEPEPEPDRDWFERELDADDDPDGAA